MIDETGYDLSGSNTFGISARCRRFVQIESPEEAREILPSLSSDNPLVIGGGSNLLLTGDYDGVVIRSGILGMGEENDGDSILLSCGSGEKWDDIVEYAVGRGMYGAENLSFIPGDAGASAVQNIGAYGVEAGNIIHGVEAVEIRTGKIFTFSKEDCGYGYRTSRFKTSWRGRFFITRVTYRLSRVFRPVLSYGNILSALEERGSGAPSARELRDVVIAVRREKLPDPALLGNAGSFFTNPVVTAEKADELSALYPGMPCYPAGAGKSKLSAGWLIQECGWKGRTLGRAGVYARQALVLVNLGGATGAEILRLCERIKADVKYKFGVELEPEVNIV